ncbi:MAG: hypothetical protein CFH19_00788 [Alphaproteobacteria bacterium MarineAlpha5_Bin9]|nr:MAG: hypothetical protein CFH19_00788 [Alphaproteobacteria bacterium MarineAlpha5_Bin9]
MYKLNSYKNSLIFQFFNKKKYTVFYNTCGVLKKCKKIYLLIHPQVNRYDML